jgi:hypothetical protein
MSARRAHWAGGALVAAVVAVAGAACGGERDPLRVGVLVECDSIFASTGPGALAGAALPLVERGAQPGAEPGDLEGAEVAGRPIEIVPACSQVTRFPRLIAETRWLVESEGADVVVGPLGTPEGAMMRRIAAKYRDVTFLVGTGGAQETTLRDPQRNLFRFTPDGAQLVAGLGAYAFEELGWRRAAVIAEGYAGGWELAAGSSWNSARSAGRSSSATSIVGTPDPMAAASAMHELPTASPFYGRESGVSPPLRVHDRQQPCLATRRRWSAVLRRPLALPEIDTSGVVLDFVLDPTTSRCAFAESLERTFPRFRPGRIPRPGVRLVYGDGGARVALEVGRTSARAAPSAACARGSHARPPKARPDWIATGRRSLTSPRTGRPQGWRRRRARGSAPSDVDQTGGCSRQTPPPRGLRLIA